MKLRNSIIRGTMQAVLGASAWLAAKESRAAWSRRVMRAMADWTVRSKRIAPAQDLASLGAAWQRSFPSKKQVPITAVTADTVYAEIQTPCPLRGSGNLHACHRMMEFDRRVLARTGGQFVVLASQATPGRTHCRVAMRMAGASLDGLSAAHERA